MLAFAGAAVSRSRNAGLRSMTQLRHARTFGGLASGRSAVAARSSIVGSNVVVSSWRGLQIRALSASVPTSADAPLLQTDRRVRNVGIIAHVDHGKTTLANRLMQHCEALGADVDRALDSDPQERSRGITIMAKAASIAFNDAQGGPMDINIVDTPGHAAFGGEVERVLHMCDGCMLVVDAREGPMPQTKFVVAKALAKQLPIMVVVNKADRDDGRIGEVEAELLDLFESLGAGEEQLDFPVVYTSAKDGWATLDDELADKGDMSVLLQAVCDHIPPPRVYGGPDEPFRMLVTQTMTDNYMGRIAVGRVAAGSVKVGDPVVCLDREGKVLESDATISKVMRRRGMELGDLPDGAEAGDIVQVCGVTAATPTHTIASPQGAKPLPVDPIDPPTMSMTFGVNDSPLAGKEGDKMTSPLVARRLEREAENNVSIDIKSAAAAPGMPEGVEVFGRGELQLAVLVQNMREEGFELSVSPPRVVFKTDDAGKTTEPYEEVTLECDEEHSGMVIERLALRKAELKDFTQVPGDRSKLVFVGPSRGLLGFQAEFATFTSGSGILQRAFAHYGPFVNDIRRSNKGALISSAAGKATGYAIAALEPRGQMFIQPQAEVYPGMVVGEHAKAGDLEINPVKAKKLTNVRASGTDEAIRLQPARQFQLEEALAYLREDELLEVLPSQLRLRKRLLDPVARKKVQREASKAAAGK